MVYKFRPKYIAVMSRRNRISIHDLVKNNRPKKTTEKKTGDVVIPESCFTVGLGQVTVDMKKLRSIYPHLKREYIKGIHVYGTVTE